MKLRAFVVMDSTLQDIAQTTYGNEARQNPRTLHLVTLLVFPSSLLEISLSPLWFHILRDTVLGRMNDWSGLLWNRQDI